MIQEFLGRVRTYHINLSLAHAMLSRKRFTRTYQVECPDSDRPAALSCAGRGCGLEVRCR